MTALAATTRNHVIQWRAYVGPPFKRADDAAFWDWSALDYGAVYAPVPAETALASDLATAATSAVLMSGTGWPTAGGFWVGPVGGYGGTWEYCTYTGKSTATLTGLTRETVDSEQTGAHLTESLVRFWYPLTGAVQLTLSESLDNFLSGLDWQATLSGDNAPQAALRNGHLVLIQERHQVKGDTVWPDWTNFLVGWLQSPNNPPAAQTVRRPGRRRLSPRRACCNRSKPRGCASGRSTRRAAAVSAARLPCRHGTKQSRSVSSLAQSIAGNRASR